MLIMGALLWLITVAGDAAHGVLMFPVLKQHSERIAFGHLSARILDAVFIAVMVLSIGFMNSGFVRVVLFPEVPGDFIQMQLTMQNGTAPQVRNEALNRLERAILDINEEYVAQNPGVMEPVNHVAVFTQGDTGGMIFVEMPMDEDRPLEGSDITAMWRERVGEIAGVKELDFSAADGFGGGPPLSFALSGTNYGALEAAARELAAKLGEYEGVFDVRNSISSGGEEIRLAIKPEAEALGAEIVANA